MEYMFLHAHKTVLLLLRPHSIAELHYSPLASGPLLALRPMSSDWDPVQVYMYWHLCRAVLQPLMAAILLASKQQIATICGLAANCSASLKWTTPCTQHDITPSMAWCTMRGDHYGHWTLLEGGDVKMPFNLMKLTTLFTA